MKKAIVSFALVLVLSMSSFAGNKVKNERKEKCEFPCEQMVKDLNLSEKQLSQLKEADKTFDTEVKAIREKKKEFEKSNRESMKAAKVRRDSTFKSHSDQRAVYSVFGTESGTIGKTSSPRFLA